MAPAKQSTASLHHYSRAYGDTNWNTPIRYLPGFGPVMAAKAAAAGVADLMSLVGRLPVYYVDPAHITPVHQLPLVTPSAPLIVAGEVLYAGQSFAARRQQHWFELHLGKAGQVQLICRWENYDLSLFQEQLRLGGWLLVAGVTSSSTSSPPCLENPHWIPLPEARPRFDKLTTLNYTPIAGVRLKFWREGIQRSVAHQAQRLDRLVDVKALTDQGFLSPSHSLHQLHLDWPTAQLHELNQGRSLAHRSWQSFLQQLSR